MAPSCVKISENQIQNCLFVLSFVRMRCTIWAFYARELLLHLTNFTEVYGRTKLIRYFSIGFSRNVATVDINKFCFFCSAWIKAQQLYLELNNKVPEWASKLQAE